MKNRSKKMNRTNKNILKVIGGVMFFVGGIWILQGINILPGSFMTGDPRWAINGAITLVIGIGLFVVSSRR